MGPSGSLEGLASDRLFPLGGDGGCNEEEELATRRTQAGPSARLARCFQRAVYLIPSVSAPALVADAVASHQSRIPMARRDGVARGTDGVLAACARSCRAVGIQLAGQRRWRPAAFTLGDRLARVVQPRATIASADKTLTELAARPSPTLRPRGRVSRAALLRHRRRG
jgi:hypothetical protein